MSAEIADAVYQLEGSRRWHAFGGSEAHALSTIVPEYLAAKGFYKFAIQDLSERGTLGAAFDTLLLGNHRPRYYGGEDGAQRQDYISMVVAHSYARYLDTVGDSPRGSLEAYGGLESDNRIVLKGLTDAADIHDRDYRYETQRQYRSNGASRNLLLPLLNVQESKEGETISSTPIAIVGGGASGVLASAMLSVLGFKNVTLFEKRDEVNGIWKQNNVRCGTKNNPFDISFEEAVARAADRGAIEGSGAHFDHFLETVGSIYVDDTSVTLRKGVVKGIEPGDLDHRITFNEEGETKTEVFPIVIYAPGLGSPLEPSDPNRMTTPHKNGQVGQRWQRQYSDSEIASLGKRVVLIGLGNSTAEIVHQLQQYQERYGTGPDYRIITHRSSRAMIQPEYAYDGPSIYRETDLPELTRLAGDLRHIERMFRVARDSGKIITSVTKWHHENNILSVTDKDGIEMRIPFDQLFTLIGYGQKKETNDSMGLVTADERTGSIKYDVDGEVQTPGFDPDVQKQRERIHPGYFALGPILKNEGNPNAIVIPGIQHQLQLLASTLIVRAAEATLKIQNGKKT